LPVAGPEAHLDAEVGVGEVAFDVVEAAGLEGLGGQLAGLLSLANRSSQEVRSIVWVDDGTDGGNDDDPAIDAAVGSTGREPGALVSDRSSPSP
jgi:hypothetical protein